MGIEPTTLKLQLLCSNQMSYEETLFVTTVLDVIQRKRRRMFRIVGKCGTRTHEFKFGRFALNHLTNFSDDEILFLTIGFVSIAGFEPATSSLSRKRS